MTFSDHLLPAPRRGGFALDDFWVWDGSIIRGEDGRYHLFASRWPNRWPFLWGYVIHSHIVRGVADRPEGPYTFEQVVLPPRGEQYWDGRMTTNGAIRKCGDTYVLFYIGSTFRGRIPEPAEMDEPWAKEQGQSGWLNTRIGIATAPSVRGPWTRRDEPILLPRPDCWDAHNTTNPAPCLHDDGRVLMVYRSSSARRPGSLLGVAGAEHYTRPFRRMRDEPILYRENDNKHSVEDPFIWWNGREYGLLVKDLNGTLTGEQYAGVHARSVNGLDWTFNDTPKAYSRTIRWDDGTTTVQSLLDRPSLLIENGTSTHLTLATSNGAPGRPATRTWVMVIPLKAGISASSVKSAVNLLDSEF